LPAAVPDDEGVLQGDPLPVGQGGEPAAQQPPGPIQRIVTMPPPPEGLLLDAAADVVDRGVAEADDVEGVKDPNGVRKAGR